MVPATLVCLMTTFTTATVIAAPRSEVWATLADIGSIADWNPGLTGSHLTSEMPTGQDATRHCDLPGGRYLKESVAEYEPERVLTMRIDESNLPLLRDVLIRFDVADEGAQTRVTVSPRYSVGLGPLGKLLDAVMIKRTYLKGMQSLLHGLKRHVEARAAAAGEN